MRAKHHPHTLQKFPVYSAAWSSDDVVALGGGGGANSRTGIKNKVKLVKVSEDGTKLEDIAALELPLHDDTPMSLAIAPSSSLSPGFVAGINSSTKDCEPTDNQNCRRIVFSDTKAEITGSRNTISAKHAYQRAVVFFPSGDLVVTASTSNEIAVLNYPSLTPACSSLTVPEADGELFDVTVNDTYLVAATTKILLVYSWTLAPSNSGTESNASNTGTKSRKSSKKKRSPAATTESSQQLELNELQKISAPAWAGQGATFRAARFATAPSTSSTSHPPNTLFAVVNAKEPKGRKFSRKSFAARYVLGDDSTRWSKEVAKRLIGDMNISSFDVSATGSLLAYGGSDCAIGVLDANSMVPLLTILRAHDFPATVVKFNPSANMLVSASADDTCRIVLLPEGFANYSSLGNLLLIITILLAILAVVAGKVMYA